MSLLDTFDLQRLAQEIKNTYNVFAPFAILDNIFKRDVYSESYRRILKKSMSTM